MAKAKILTHDVSLLRLRLEDLKRLLDSNVEERVKIQKIEVVCKSLYITPVKEVKQLSKTEPIPEDLVTHTIEK